VTEEVARFLAKARRALADAEAILPLAPRVAAREAYVAAFHAAQALIQARTGEAAKTHKGVHTSFLRLTRDEAGLPAELRGFLSRSYSFKAVSDYDTGPDADIPPATATAAIAGAGQFLAAIASLLPPDPP
jgi:uncharacterized protein (UPF0332 family)